MLALVWLGSASCALVRSFAPAASAPPRPFNHVAHADRGVDCLACHETADKGEAAGMPAKDVCYGCHADIDKEPGKKLEQTVAWFLDGQGNPAWSAFTRQTSEIKFSHGAHKAACIVCHQGIDKDTGLTPEGKFQRMESCVACHAARASTKNDCATCHEQLDRSRAPVSHANGWKALHGVCSKSGRSASTANDCAMCHHKNECQSCHVNEAPSDHTNFWRMRGHGAAAGMSRERCETCHASDACVRCHQESAPRSHASGWTGPSARHCNGCHVPLQASKSCFVCHKETPGHASAPAKPSWHNPAMNCRSCHAQSLTHPDNGDNCNSCHQ